MMKKAAAVLAALALTVCVSRVAAYAAPAGDPHACCRGEAAPADAPSQSSLAECCPVAAFSVPPSPARAELSFVVIADDALPAPFAVEVVSASVSGPPGPQTMRSSVPARAPPLA